MKIVVAEKILEKLEMEKTSANYQKIYQIGDLILKESDDYFVLETALERGLVDAPKCEVCDKKKERSYSFNGVFGGFSCPDEEIDGSHNPSLMEKVKGVFK